MLKYGVPFKYLHLKQNKKKRYVYFPSWDPLRVSPPGKQGRAASLKNYLVEGSHSETGLSIFITQITS